MSSFTSQFGFCNLQPASSRSRRTSTKGGDVVAMEPTVTTVLERSTTLVLAPTGVWRLVDACDDAITARIRNLSRSRPQAAAP